MSRHQRALLLICLSIPAAQAFSRAAIRIHRPALRPAAICSTPAAVPQARLSAAATAPHTRAPLLRRAARALVSAVVATVAPLPLLAASSATFGSVPFLPRVFYSVKQTLLQQAPVVVLLFAVLACFVGGFLYKIVEGANFTDGSFQAYSILFNVPGADSTADETPLGKLVSQGLVMVGILTFAVVIGIASDGISSQIENLRLTNERVQKTRHTVLVNWGEYTKPMMRQLEAA